jgi:hypothetical protein
MLEKQCSFALLPVDMGIELECNSQGFRRINAQRRRRRNLLQLQMLKPTSNAQRRGRRRRNHLQLQMFKTTSNAICKKEKKCTINCTKKKNKSAITRRKKVRKWCNVQRRRKSAIAMVDTKEKCR